MAPTKMQELWEVSSTVAGFSWSREISIQDLGIGNDSIGSSK